MAKTQFTEKKPRLSYKRLLAALLALVLAFILLTSVISVAGKYIAIRRHIRELKGEQATLAAKSDVLTKKNAYLATTEGQEQALRDKYNVVKPGEGMIVIVPPDMVPGAAKGSSTASRWWSAIIHGLGIHKRE